jgi:hypothetical protein
MKIAARAQSKGRIQLESEEQKFTWTSVSSFSAYAKDDESASSSTVGEKNKSEYETSRKRNLLQNVWAQEV